MNSLVTTYLFLIIRLSLVASYSQYIPSFKELYSFNYQNLSRFINLNFLNHISLDIYQLFNYRFSEGFDYIYFQTHNLSLQLKNNISNNYLTNTIYYFSINTVNDGIDLINNKITTTLNSEFALTIKMLYVNFGKLLLFLSLLYLIIFSNKKVSNVVLVTIFVCYKLGIINGIWYLLKLIMLVSEFSINNFSKFCITLILLINFKETYYIISKTVLFIKSIIFNKKEKPEYSVIISKNNGEYNDKITIKEILVNHSFQLKNDFLCSFRYLFYHLNNQFSVLNNKIDRLIEFKDNLRLIENKNDLRYRKKKKLNIKKKEI